MSDADDDPVLRGQFRTSDHRRVAHGTFLRKREGLSAEDERHRDLRAWRSVLPPDAVFTHVTGAELLGWDLPALPEQAPVFAATRGARVPSRPGLIASRLTNASTPGTVRGLPVDAPAEILLRAARDVGELDLLVMLESALLLGDVGESDLETLIGTGRPGVRTLREALNLHRAAAALAGCRPESALLADEVVASAAVEEESSGEGEAGGENASVRPLLSAASIAATGGSASSASSLPDDGRVSARTVPVPPEQRSTTLQRAFLVAMGVRPGEISRAQVGSSSTASLEFDVDHLVERDVAAMHRVDTLLRRPARLERLRRWRRLVRESLLTETGRERVLNRWHRQMGVTDHPGTA